MHTKLHENRNDRFCCAAQKKKYDCEILIDREYKTKLKLTMLRKCQLMASFQEDSVLLGHFQAAKSQDCREESPSVCCGPEQARASPLWRRASRASQVLPRAGPGESSLSAAQCRPPTGRPQRVDSKSQVEGQCCSHCATLVILVTE